MDMDIYLDLPGGDDFCNVAQVFLDAAKEMSDDAMIMAPGFTLNEAMSAIEIGDPRMDSGAAITSTDDAEETRSMTPFDPLVPLLPEEVCWILDQALACEMKWHEGNSLLQTVYTCLYMHHLSSMNPDILDEGLLDHAYTPERPLKLVTHALRAGILGMVKCVDYAYRELVKGNVHDCEDWQGDKADVSLGEGIQPKKVVQVLDSAESWLSSPEATNLRYRDALLFRLRLRRVLFNIFTLQLPVQAPLIPDLVEQARDFIGIIRSVPVPPPRPPPSISNGNHQSPQTYSNVRASFDKYMLRKLHSFMPLRPLALPSHTEAWDALEGMLDGLEELARMAKCDCLLSWVTVSEIRTILPRWPHRRIPYLRSAYQSVFSDGITIMGHHPFPWLVDRFFIELTGTRFIEFGYIFKLAEQANWAAGVLNTKPGVGQYGVDDLERDIAKLLMQHVWAAYHNRPRQRRHLMRVNDEWYSVYNSVNVLISKAQGTVNSSIPTLNVSILRFIPLTLLHWRARIIQDIMLSGVELELYSADELPFVYWYLWKVTEKHLEVLSEMREGLRSVHGDGSVPEMYVSSQINVISTVQAMSRGTFTVLAHKSCFDPIRRCTNYAVRFKWMFSKDEKAIGACEDVFAVNYGIYLREESEMVLRDADERRRCAVDSFSRAIMNLEALSPIVKFDPVLYITADEYSKYFLGGLLTTAKALLESLNSEDAPSWMFSSAIRKTWCPDVCPWFPRIEKVAGS